MSSLQQCDPLYVSLAFALSVSGVLISGLKLHVVLRALDYSVDLFSVLRAYFIGAFFNNFIPTSVGGDIIKILELNRIELTTTTDNSLSVIVERISGIIVLLSIGSAFLWIQPQWYRLVGLGFLENGQYWLISVFIFSLIVLVINRFGSPDKNKETTGWRNHLNQWLKFPITFTGTSVLVLALSAVFHAIRALVIVLLVTALGHKLVYGMALFILPIIAFAAFLPISMGGIGLREGIITFCLNTFGIPLGSAFGASLILRLLTLFHSVTGGILYALGPQIISEPSKPYQTD
jgi:uncharacterized protein (TIRG00374 family)